jgi:hypothetical protein
VLHEETRRMLGRVLALFEGLLALGFQLGADDRLWRQERGDRRQQQALS